VAHTTGRTHPLAFRAGTALLYHFGIEWDITRADPESRAELAGWVELHKRFRGLAHTSRYVRADHPDPLVWVTGVVAGDQSEALYTVAVMGLTVAPTPGRLRLPGLDPARTYTVELVTTPEPADLRRAGHRPPPLAPPTYRLPGRALMSAGIQLPMTRPDGIRLIHVFAD
jgi:alpha-galactosidase